MNLLFVVPDKEKDLGNLEFGGPEQASREDKKRVGRQEVVVHRRYKLFSDVQRADDIEVVIPAQVGEKHFDYLPSFRVTISALIALYMICAAYWRGQAADREAVTSSNKPFSEARPMVF